MADQLYTMRLQGGFRREIDKLIYVFKKNGGTGDIFQEANEQALKIVQDKAVKNLSDSITANRSSRSSNTGNLAKLIRNPAAHRVRKDGYDFLLQSNIEKVNASKSNPLEKVEYAHALEFGNSDSVGRLVPFRFLGPRNGDYASSKFSQRGPSNVLRRGQLQNRLRSTDTYFGVRRLANRLDGKYDYVTADRIIGPRRFKYGGRAGGEIQTDYLRKAPLRLVRITRPVPEYAFSRKAGQAVSQDVYRNIIVKLYNDKMTSIGVNSNLQAGLVTKRTNLD